VVARARGLTGGSTRTLRVAEQIAMEDLNRQLIGKSVVDDLGRRVAVLVDNDDWERILAWLDAGAQSWHAVPGLAELWKADGDPERAGWPRWSTVRQDWPVWRALDPNEQAPFCVRVRPAAIAEARQAPEATQRRIGRYLDRMGSRPRLWRAFRVNPMPVEQGWEVRWFYVDDWHVVYALDVGAYGSDASGRDIVVLTVYKQLRYPGP